ncbi:hypothetical protein [Streptomyces sp. t39]|uniref:GHMP family kinase ATP-binding protein n=1 Tax=Streptomyces sp. t39 TaxID=1828156 RepID=UPI0011CE627A|nr:hypothetical protein [Streptomyces sp. t39]TXS52452.1 hypothetical protein EAO77_20485 [Streptomyces sp. t39]
MLTPDAAAVGRGFAGVCHGTLGELYQGPLRAGPDPDIALVSFPVDRHSWVYFTPGDEPQPVSGPEPGTASGPEPGTASGPLGEKTQRAVRLFLDRHGRTLPPGRFSAHSDLTVGVGMASSTADIVAALRCLFRVFSLPEDPDTTRDVLAAIERADSVFLEEFALHLSARHRVVRRLGTGVVFHTAFVTEPGTVDTSATTPVLLRHYRRRGDEYERCLTDLLKGFSAKDAPAVARAATTSAVLSQEALPKQTFGAVLAHRDEFGADGVFVAHTGSLVGYLFAHRPAPSLKGELSAFFRSLGHQCTFAQGGFA